MALSVKVGSFTQPAVTGNQAVTGVGFQPKAVLFFGTRQTADGNAVDACHFWGAATSAADRWAGSTLSRDAAAASVVHVGKKTDKCYVVLQHSTTVLAEADFVSFDSDGFTVNWTTADATARVVNYIAFGGADLVSAKAGNFNTIAVTGAQNVNTVGFQPSTVMLFGVTDGTGTGVQARSGMPSLGWAASPTAQACTTAYDNSGAATSDTARKQLTDHCFYTLDGEGSAILTQMLSDGFALNFDDAMPAAKLVFYLALKGPQAAVGSFNQPTVTGNQAITGLDFQPKTVLLASFCNAASTAIVDNGRQSLGAASGVTERASIWLGALDNQANMVCDQALTRSKVLTMLTEGTPTLNAEADLASLNADGFTLNWTTVDGTPRQVLYLALGDTLPSTAGLGFHGSAATFRTLGNAATPQNLFTLTNRSDSLVRVAIRRLEVYATYTAVLTAVESQLCLHRTSSIPTGGTELAKVPRHSSFQSVEQVVARGATASDGGAATAITATAAGMIAQAFIGRIHTAVGHVQSGSVINLLPAADTDNNEPYDRLILQPNEALVVRIVNPTAGNNPTTNHYIVNCEWEEVPI